MKKRYLFLPIIVGCFFPSGLVLVFQIMLAGVSPMNALVDVLHSQFSNGGLFHLMLLNFIPYAALVVIIIFLHSVANCRSLEYAFWGGLAPLICVTLLGHFSVWFPVYSPSLHASSTSVLAFPFMVFYSLILLPFGLLVGWAASLIPKRSLVAFLKGLIDDEHYQ